MNVQEVRQALAAVDVAPFSSYPSYIGANDLPMIVVGQPTRIVYARDFSGTSELSMPVHVIVSRADEQSAQDLMDQAMSIGITGSVVDALQALEGPWSALAVNEVAEPVSVQVGSAECINATFNVTVRARRAP